MLGCSLKISSIDRILWSIIIFFLVWQVFLAPYTIISNLALTCLYICNYRKLSPKERKIELALLCGIFCLIGYSFIMQNEISLIFRFALILFFVLGAYLIRLNYKICLKRLFQVSFLLCLFLIMAEIFLFLFGEEYAKMIRNYVQDKGIGDVDFYGFYYKVQIKGNAIIPFIYMLSYAIELFPLKCKTFFRIIYLSAIFIAGNFAYLLAVVAFHCVVYFCNIKSYKMLYKRLFIGLVILFTIGGGIISYIDAVFEEKKDESNAMRIEQAILLLEDLSRNPITLLGGAGLGNTVDVTTHFRSYVGATYYELQVLYILNQLGLVSFLVFILVNILFVFKYMPDTKIKMVYAGYILYAVTNPYIIDTNQVVVIITLLSAQYQISNHLPSIWKK